MGDDPINDTQVQHAQNRLTAIAAQEVYSELFPADNASTKPTAGHSGAPRSEAEVVCLPPTSLTQLAAYPTDHDPFAYPPVQLDQTRLKALGVKTVYSKILPAENDSYKSAAYFFFFKQKTAYEMDG